MKALEKYPSLALGLRQIPKRGLNRLQKALEDGKSPLAFTGCIVRISMSRKEY